VVAAAAIAPVGAKVSPLRTLAERTRAAGSGTPEGRVAHTFEVQRRHQRSVSSRRRSISAESRPGGSRG
jgi:hypothetical protein